MRLLEPHYIISAPGLSATYMFFRGSMFQQTYGTAMGSPVSVTIAMAMITDTGDPMSKL